MRGQIEFTKIYGMLDFNMERIEMLRSNNISSISIACSEYERELLVEAKEEYPELKINCWFYRFNRMEEIL